MADPPSVLIAAFSGRALAAAARRAGYRPLVADLFRDSDTRRLARRSVLVPATLREGFAGPDLKDALRRLSKAGEAEPVGLVYGAGFEDRPALLARLAETIPILGNDAATVERVKDPATFFSGLNQLEVPRPEVRFAPPERARGWLVKRRGASGGQHIRPARSAAPPRPGVYFQRRVAGQPISALFLADGARALTLGFSLQWPSGSGGAYRFGGALRPAPLSPALAADLEAVAGRLASAFGLRGLNSADFMVRQEAFDLLEVNPRPGATLDIFDTLPEAPLLALHYAACRGKLPDDWVAPRGAAACAVVYARRAIVIPEAGPWPRWCADRPPAGTRIRRGEPVCTVLARAPTAATARRRVLERQALILGRFDSGRTGPNTVAWTTGAALAV